MSTATDRLQAKHREKKRQAFDWMKEHLPGLEEELRDLGKLRDRRGRPIPFELSLRDGETKIWN